jgi:hypothetical protein
MKSLHLIRLILQISLSLGIPIGQTSGLPTPTDLPREDSDLLLEVIDRVILTLHRLSEILGILFIGLEPITINVHHVVMEPTEIGLDPVHLSGQLVDAAVVIAPKFAMTTSLRTKSLHDRRQIFIILRLRSHRRSLDRLYLIDHPTPDVLHTLEGRVDLINEDLMLSPSSVIPSTTINKILTLLSCSWII